MSTAPSLDTGLTYLGPKRRVLYITLPVTSSQWPSNPPLFPKLVSHFVLVNMLYLHLHQGEVAALILYD